MRERWIVALAVVCCVVALGGATLVGIYLSNVLVSQFPSSVLRQGPYLPYPTDSAHGTFEGTVLNVTVFHHDDQLYSGDNKPFIVTSGLFAEDIRSNYNSAKCLHIGGFLNNTGGGTAYGAYLRVVAMNKEGTVVDTEYEFGGVTPHMGLGLDFRLAYSGSPIQNCTITPVYNDNMGLPKFNQTPS